MAIVEAGTASSYSSNGKDLKHLSLLYQGSFGMESTLFAWHPRVINSCYTQSLNEIADAV